VLHIGYRDRDFLCHTGEVMQDMVLGHDGYTPDDEAALGKVQQIGKGGTALVVTGEDLDVKQLTEIMREVISAELAHWVPDASQRLIWRAARALGFEPTPRPGYVDCGAERIDHPLVPAWEYGLYLMRCSACARLFRV
jgi:hypothetical protein